MVPSEGQTLWAALLVVKDCVYVSIAVVVVVLSQRLSQHLLGLITFGVVEQF